MLKSLYISSFVIIDKMRVDFNENMNVLTGETGAGKSIIIDALGQLCGNRSSTSFIKKGCSKAVIEGIFDVSVTAELKNLCDELHIEVDEQFVITKEILDSGKSNIKINYQNASNNALKLLTPYFIDIHSQFETQKLFEEKNHILLLDEYAYKDLHNILHNYQEIYQQYKSTKRLLENTVQEDMSDEQLDFLQSQYDEIDEMNYTDEEVDELETELKMLQNYEKLNEDIQVFDQLMNTSQGVLPSLKEALNYIQNILEFGDFQDAYDNIYNYYYNLMDEYENIMDTYRSFHFDEYRFNEVQDILYKINRLKRKYGMTMERVHEYQEELAKKIDAIHHRDEYIQELTKDVNIKKNQCLELAQDIHHIRVKYARQFENDITKELKNLYLDKALFKVDIKSVELNGLGMDQIHFMVSINQGQDLSLLNESASGGEISRIMLAIKTIILAYQSLDTIIFDEVDTGVSGKVASRIGEKMRQLALKKQVICITHLPQVASLAQYHYCIEKKSTDEQTISSIRLLNEEERVVEIAKMLSGEQLSQEAINNAKQLLNV